MRRPCKAYYRADVERAGCLAGVQSVRVSGVEDRVVEPFRTTCDHPVTCTRRSFPAFGTSSRPVLGRAPGRSVTFEEACREGRAVGRREMQERLGADPAGRCPRLVTSGRGSTRLRDARSSSRSGTRPGPAGDARISPTAGAGGCPSTAAARAGSDCAARRRSAGRGPLQVPFDDVVRGTSRIGPSGDRREEGPTPERPEVDIV